VVLTKHKSPPTLHREFVAHEDISPRANKFDLRKLAPGNMQKLADFTPEKAGDDDPLWLELAGDFANHLCSYQSGATQYQNAPVNTHLISPS
jgi:hypothetical protein